MSSNLCGNCRIRLRGARAMRAQIRRSRNEPSDHPRRGALRSSKRSFSMRSGNCQSGLPPQQRLAQFSRSAVSFGHLRSAFAVSAATAWASAMVRRSRCRILLILRLIFISLSLKFSLLPAQNFSVCERFAEKLSHVGGRRSWPARMHAASAQHAKRTLHQIVPGIRGADQSQVLSSGSDIS